MKHKYQNISVKSGVFAIFARFLSVLLILSSLISGAQGQHAVFEDGFELASTTWAPSLDHSASVNGVFSGTSSFMFDQGSFHEGASGGAFTQSAGYTSGFPVGDHTASLGLHLDVSGGFTDDSRAEDSSAVADVSGVNPRDFDFYIAYYHENYFFKLASISSTHALESQNAISFGTRQRFDEAADGTDSGNADARLTGVLSEAGGGWMETGEGTVELSAANTCTGLTTVDSGMLLVNTTTGSGSDWGRGANDAPLDGSSGSSGSLTTIASGGTLDGGVGSLDYSANLNLALGSTWFVDLVNGATDDSDQVSVSGDLPLAGPPSSNESSGIFSEGGSYPVGTLASQLGLFSHGVTDGAIISSGGGASNVNAEFQNMSMSAAPEPSTLGFLGAGIVVFASRRYQRRRAACA